MSRIVTLIFAFALADSASSADVSLRASILRLTAGDQGRVPESPEVVASKGATRQSDGAAVPGKGQGKGRDTNQ